MLAPRQIAHAAGGDEMLVQTFVQRFKTEHRDAGRCQFDRQRNALEPAADRGDRAEPLRGEHEVRVAGDRAFHEQPERSVGAGLFGGDRNVRRDPQRRQTVHGLTFDRQTFATRGQDADAGARAQDRRGRGRSLAHHVLAVVEDQQERARLEPGRERRQRIGGRGGRYVEHRSQRAGDERPVTDRREVDEPDLFVPGTEQSLRDLHRGPGLADAAGAGQGDEAMPFEQRSDRGDLLVAAHERRQPHRQVVSRRHVRGPRP